MTEIDTEAPTTEAFIPQAAVEALDEAVIRHVVLGAIVRSVNQVG
jgi:hypothetical protein